ncbi:fumarylacetoacetate hydrolase family protein [Fictibacillus iocasae]|uniref:Fumarylacetoacetate hydrolase family protein n=1 Tax=Fictibacillus iocasae TaxID=2715437 RepID=A0ABW2NPU5_9BACL
MKLISGVYDGRSFIGEWNDNGSIFNLTKAAERSGKTFARSLLEGIQQGSRFMADIYELKDEVEDEEGLSLNIKPEDPLFAWNAPIERPLKNIFCVGKNYRDHAIEMGGAADIPEDIIVFSKAPTAVIAHEALIPLHESITSELDYEGELAVIIGKTGTSIQECQAHDYIFGYTILNDVTARDLQQKHKQFLIGKSLDGTCPMGPFITLKEAVQDHSRLSIETKVNGEVRQSGTTGDFIFPIERIIAELSKGMTLEAGDIIATGTPAGVGKGMKPPVFLKTGDVVEITIEGIGTLRNEVK